MKKKKFLYYSAVAILVLLITISCYAYYKIQKPEIIVHQPVVVDVPIPNIPEIEKNGINLKNIQNTYQNNDIVAYLVIPDVMETTVVQSSDNEYYLRRLLDGSYSIKGTPFMDYRTTFENKKILIYGHSGEEKSFPFLALHNYEQEEYYKEHPTIYLYSLTKKYTYRIISSYLETEDYDYVNINSFRGLTWLEHINKLKNKSDFSTNITLNDNSKILILQTCDMGNLLGTGKYRLVVGVLTKIEDNIYE